MIKLLTADSRPVVLAGLKQLFDGDSEIKIVKQFSQAGSLQEFLSKNKADVLMMDTAFNGSDSLLQVRYLQKHLPEIKILLFTDDARPETIRRANYAGVAGYLFKTASFITLKQAISNVAAGLRVRDDSIDPAKLTVRKTVSKPTPGASSKKMFSPRESQVLQCLSEGLTNHEISKKLGVTQSTVETFRARIMSKSKRKNAAELIKWAVEKGLIK